MELEIFLANFGHDHPLILKDKQTRDEGSVLSCTVCSKQIISGLFYSCEECENVFVNKSCTELPLEIQHPLHPDHSLTLTSPTAFNYAVYHCDACKSQWKNFVYHCFLCNFGLDLRCASVTERTVEHPSHIHPLRILQRTTLSFCDACGTKHEGVFYACNTCDQYWIHQDCASLPTMFENTDYHDHPLTLAYCFESLPSRYASFGQLCQICEKQTFGLFWVYYCGKCGFLVHVNCFTSKSEHFMSALLPKKEFYSSRRKSKMRLATEDSNLEVVYLPLQDGFSSLVDHFRKDIRLRAKENTICQPRYCHQRPLVLFDDVQGNDTTLDVSNDHIKYQKNLCNACIMPITSTPYFKCAGECNSILHKSCAELPDEIRHPFHSQHALVLFATGNLGWFWCKGCHFLSNGFGYSCACWG